MYGRSNVRPVGRPAATNNRTTVRAPVNTSYSSGSMGQTQPVARAPANQYEDESFPTQARNAPRQPKPAGTSHGYGDYDHLYKDAPRTTAQAPAMPKFAICYVCGRKYGTQSIEIHEPQCLEKWHIENAKLPPHMRRSAPRKPDAYVSNGGNYALDNVNDTAYEASKLQLIPCDNCGRKFAPDRVQAHQRTCKSNNVSTSSGGYPNQGNGDRRMAERTVQPRGKPSYNDYDDTPTNQPIRRGGGKDGSYQNNAPSKNGGLYPCSICNRTFSSDRIQQHETACMKSSKPRRTFDSTKQRLQGTEAATFYRKNKGRNEPAKPQIPKSSWKQKHEDFIRSIRYAKQISRYEKSGGRLADLPPPPVSINPDYVQCPHCGRNYAPSVAERHIPKCVNIQNKPKPPPGLNRTAPQQRMGASAARTPITNYNSSGGFNNNAAYPPPHRSMRGGRY